MELSGHLERLSPLIEGLTTAPNASERHRLILEGLAEAAIVDGAELWLESDRPGHFERVGSFGTPPEGRPDPTRIAAVADGHLTAHLPPATTIIHAGRTPTRVALCLEGLAEPEEWEDLLEAILVLAWQMGSPWPTEDPLDLVDTLLAPFRQPAGGSPSIQDQRIRSLLSLMEPERSEESRHEGSSPPPPGDAPHAQDGA